jgi:hypothetical protein
MELRERRLHSVILVEMVGLTFRLTTAPAPTARSGRCAVREVLLVE